MPTLSASTTAQLRQRLIAARAEVLPHIQGRTESPEEAPVSLRAHLGQPDDMAQASNVGDNEMAQLGQEQALLRDIDSALARLDEGVANVCIVCGNSIPDERLLALPTAQTCMPCQQRTEAQGQGPQGPPCSQLGFVSLR
ncbi:TraR/DksA family transcriptional regulator [Massilia sp. CF038]|uniref:TraR/DksA family transcriptional regulator n=1 Tax=Massilia sp. CF038 TaxID=1881045 RepID=UPI00091E8072|nr:TraR/DksA family transcriptional regulator [Massilia sp. CF038]SHH71703.1 transcriptional regulator, TraR/DksA family [Massilia sp. CF038]